MNKWIAILWSLFASISFAGEVSPPEEGRAVLNIDYDGTVRFSPQRGKTSWNGIISFKHRLFEMSVKGQAVLFSGPAVYKKSTVSGPLSVKDLAMTHEYISLVSLGDIIITFIDSKGMRKKRKAHKIVFLFEREELLIDGELVSIQQGDQARGR